MAFEKLDYRPGDKFHPLCAPQTIEAELFLKFSDDPNMIIEGICFAENGDMYFVTCHNSTLVRVDMETKTPTVVYEKKGMNMAGLKISKDGKFFICCLGSGFGGPYSGRIIVLNPDYSVYDEICMGYDVDDMTFDKDGGFYFTYYIGTPQEPSGAICYVTPDYKKVTTVYRNFAGPNGVALAPDESCLWVTETRASQLHRIDLVRKRTCIPYRFEGGVGPDSCEIDVDGNLYAAFVGQGRVLAFNHAGHHIGNILIPGRDEGENLDVTHPTVRPGYEEVYISTNGKVGAAIYRAGSYAKGPSIF